MLKRKKLLPLDRYGFWARGTIGELSADINQANVNTCALH